MLGLMSQDAWKFFKIVLFQIQIISLKIESLALELNNAKDDNNESYIFLTI